MTGDSFGSLANLDLNLLVPLDAILAERNITRAAGRLHVSQPAVSASLAKLRRAFDDPLIVRQGNVTNLTPFAETLVEPVREILQQVDKTLRRRSTFDPRTDARTFSLATSDYTLSVLVGQLLRRLPDAAPQVRLAVRQNVALHPAEVIDESLDLTIMPRDMLKGLEGLPSQSLFVETFSCAVWAKHPEVGETVSVEDLQRLPFLGYQRQPGGRSWVEQHLARQGVEMKPEVVLSNFAVAPLLLEGTRLVTFIADRMAALVAGSHDIRTLPSPVEIPPLVETMFWHPRHSDDPAHQWLRRFVADVAATI